jgi:hypothetical protein
LVEQVEKLELKSLFCVKEKANAVGLARKEERLIAEVMARIDGREGRRKQKQ